MAHLSRQSSGGLTSTLPAPRTVGAAAVTSSARNQASPAATAPLPCLSSWEELFHSLDPAGRQELFALASRQGLLYAHQLPAPSGSRVAPQSADPPQLTQLKNFLAGRVEVKPAPPQPLSALLDTDLDECQRDAVGKALGTPDICLIQGLPGTGKTRVAAEIIAQAARRGERVLLVAQHTAGLDRILEWLANDKAVLSLRCLEPTERAEQLRPAARVATFAERVSELQRQTRQSATAARVTAARRCAQEQRESALWPQLHALAEQHQALQAERAGLAAKRAEIPQQVDRLVQLAMHERASPACADPFVAELRQVAVVYRTRQSQLTALQAEYETELADKEGTRKKLTRRIERLRPLVLAKQARRWWSPAWWRALVHKDVASKLRTQELQHVENGARLEVLQRDIESNREQQREAKHHFARLCSQQQETEARRRQESGDREDRERAQQQAILQRQWEHICPEIERDSARPAACTVDAVRAAHAEWQKQCQDDDARCGFAQKWASCLEETVETWPARLPAYVNLVAATLEALHTDERFGDHGSAKMVFDLLIVEEADQVTEVELLTTAQRGRRWVLLGEPQTEYAAESKPIHASQNALRAPSCFQRLWRNLHADARHLPYAWGRERDRLCCRLRIVPAHERQWLATERVADFQDIELRILTLPRERPVLAEIVFPAPMTISQAKQYIYRELEELPIQVQAEGCRWSEEADRLCLHFGRVSSDQAEAVTLETGVREIFGQDPRRNGNPTGWHTLRLEFDRSAGWQRERAQAWVERYLKICDLGRSCSLEVVKRMEPALAAVLCEWLYDGGHPFQLVSDKSGAVEFIAVPPLGARNGAPPQQRNGAKQKQPARPNIARPALPKAGAGLELDLSAARHGDRLPAELRAQLPQRGLVNYFEAKAVVHKLEALAADPGLRADGTVAVIALYATQAELIRRLVSDSRKLRGAALAVEIGIPDDFRQRDFAVVLVSLTRSHSHRAVSYGDGAPSWRLALTRARRWLFLLGDPGTLLRRTQWDGALDHLDKHEAQRERRLVKCIVHDLQNPENSLGVRLCAGDGA